MPEYPDLPEMLVAVIPRDEINFTDNWNVTGLRRHLRLHLSSELRGSEAP